MSLLLQTPSKSESRLVQVLDEYLAAVQAGQAPSKEELLARYPELAGDLAECLASLEFIRQSAVMAVTGSSGDVAPGPRLGDFRILREIGRGGMGIVYEAEQVSLGRRVALKVLPFAGALDARQLQRFKNEAQAAAHLQHQNIVPVYFVGSERGVHFYAMQFVEGQTLAQVIAELRHGEPGCVNARSADQKSEPESDLAQSRQDAKDPLASSRLCASQDEQPTGTYTPESDGSNGHRGEVKEPTVEDRCLDTVSAKPQSSTLNPRSSSFLRTIAELGIQAAEAIDHAHQMGVIHRDIKPGNILLETDSPLSPGGRGDGGEGALPRLWITDFGLAQFQAGAELTMTGDLIGTLRYMSPEQALAKRVIVDHRTDIYSLGATVYELLTLRPPYEGNDRQELLRQIAFEEPKPLRRINSKIPVELETIVLKSLEKNPADRYATAKELADDLRRYLQHEPIRAKKPTWMQRAGKWSRRHPAFVRAAVVMLFLITVGSILSTWLVWQEKQRTNSALEAEATARNRAEEQRRQARKAVDTMYTQVAEKWLNNQPEMEEQQREFLAEALKFYKQFAQEESTDPEHQFQKALAYHRVARIEILVFREGFQAEAGLLQAIGILEKLAQEFPVEPAYVDELAQCYFLLGWSRAANFQEEEKWIRRGVELWETLSAAYPGERSYRMHLGIGLYNLANPVRYSGRRSEAEIIGRRAIAVMEAAPPDLTRTPYDINMRNTSSPSRPSSVCPATMLADSYDTLAQSLVEGGRLEEALDCYRTSIRLLMPLAGKNPNVPDFQLGMGPWDWMNFGTSHSLVGDLLRRTRKPEEARPFIERSIRILEGLVARFPKTSAYVEHLHGSYVSLARLEQACGRGDAADNACKEALRLAEQLFARPKTDLAVVLPVFLLGSPVAKFRDPQRALKMLEKAITIRPEHADTWNRLALARYRTNKWNDALEPARQAKRFGGAEYFSAAFVEAMAHWQLGNKEKALNCYQEAAQWLEKTHPGDEGLCLQRDEAAALLGIRRPSVPMDEKKEIPQSHKEHKEEKK